MIEIKKIRELVKLMVSNGLTELDLQGESERVTLKRGNEGPVVLTSHAPTHAVAAPPTPAATAGAPAPSDATPTADTPSADDGLVAIRSPMVGTFYTKANPEAKPFVAVGDKLQDETVVCIIEAMKVFNEIKAEASGTIEKILVEDGQAVEFDQPLFMVRPG